MYGLQPLVLNAESNFKKLSIIRWRQLFWHALKMYEIYCYNYNNFIFISPIFSYMIDLNGYFSLL